ncbi:MAG: ABC transporter ATP-binding protein [Proteobacteria bacterium]|nr:MAG: ABC transporter ATP-binding protein [Pseudomonadota bacterium]
MIDTSSVSIQLHKVGLAFGDNQILRDIDLEIVPGEFFAFLGPSGSGKSTLLRLIAGFGPAPTGQVLIGGEDVTQLPPWKRNVGMVFQNYALWPHMTVAKNVAFGLEERRLSRGEIRKRVDAALEVVGLGEFATRRPAQLSGGQQQRVALARTIVIEPRVLLLDEPLSNLDANLRIQMRRDIRELQQRLGITTIFVTHDQEEANTIADRMAVLNDGVLQQVGTPVALYDHPDNRFVASFLGTANLLDGEVRREGARGVFYAAGDVRIPLDTEAKSPGQATAMFRPQNLRIVENHEPCQVGHVRLNGRIVHREFLGNIIRYLVEQEGKAILVDDGHEIGGRSFQIDDVIAMDLNVAQVRILAA